MKRNHVFNHLRSVVTRTFRSCQSNPSSSPFISIFFLFLLRYDGQNQILKRSYKTIIRPAKKICVSDPKPQMRIRYIIEHCKMSCHYSMIQIGYFKKKKKRKNHVKRILRHYIMKILLVDKLETTTYLNFNLFWDHAYENNKYFS